MHSVNRRVIFTLLFGAGLYGRAQGIPKDYGQPETPRVVAFVQQALRTGDLAAAETIAAQYRRLHGDTPEALEAMAWVARGQVASHRLDEGWKTAEEIKRASQAALGTRTLDSEPYLPLALGAAYEVEAEALFAQNKRAQALQLLQQAAVQWRGTSLVDRLQKNINLMTLQGQPMPPLREGEWIGKKPAPVSTLKGKVVLLYFWAHWCSDCKLEAPVVSKLLSDLGRRGLVVVAPTRRYGYTADDDHAAPAKETAWMAKVFEKYYAGIANVPVPLDAGNFQRFGASTTPTLVLVDRRGVVRLYHPGLMDEASLRAAIEPLLAGS